MWQQQQNLPLPSQTPSAHVTAEAQPQGMGLKKHGVQQIQQMQTRLHMNAVSTLNQYAGFASKQRKARYLSQMCRNHLTMGVI